MEIIEAALYKSSSAWDSLTAALRVGWPNRCIGLEHMLAGMSVTACLVISAVKWLQESELTPIIRIYEVTSLHALAHKQSSCFPVQLFGTVCDTVLAGKGAVTG